MLAYIFEYEFINHFTAEHMLFLLQSTEVHNTGSFMLQTCIFPS